MTSAIMAAQCVRRVCLAFFHSATESQSVNSRLALLTRLVENRVQWLFKDYIDYIYHKPTDCFVVPVQQNWVNVNPYRKDGVEQTDSSSFTPSR